MEYYCMILDLNYINSFFLKMSDKNTSDSYTATWIYFRIHLVHLLLHNLYTAYIILICNHKTDLNQSQFMAKLHKDPSKSDLIDKFHNTYRYLMMFLCWINWQIRCWYFTPRNWHGVKLIGTFLDLDVSISKGELKTKFFDKTFPIVNFPFLDWDVPLASSCGVYISIC